MLLTKSFILSLFLMLKLDDIRAERFAAGVFHILSVNAQFLKAAVSVKNDTGIVLEVFDKA